MRLPHLYLNILPQSCLNPRLGPSLLCAGCRLQLRAAGGEALMEALTFMMVSKLIEV